MPKKTKSTSKETNISPIWCELLASPQLTGLVLMFAITILIIHQMLPQTTRNAIAVIVAYPIITLVMLSAIMCIGYFNWIAGLICLILLAYMLLPFKDHSNVAGTQMEGFSSSEGDVPDLSNPDDIKSLFKPGFFRTKLEEARKLNREVNGETAARDKMERFLDKRLSVGKGQGGRSGIKKRGRERFNNSGGGGEKAIQQRRFNPGSEEDANLLLTMDIMDDINDRIKFKYEDKKYLKRYIRQKLEEVVELLGLLDDEDDE